MIVIFSPTLMTKARYCSLFMIGIKANFLFDSNETINKYIATLNAHRHLIIERERYQATFRPSPSPCLTGLGPSVTSRGPNIGNPAS